MPIQSLLIANRGEIARRVIRTCRAMGIRAVAVYSEADRDAPFVAEADTAVHIGASEARNSYLNMDAVITAARESGAETIHPGYGFLSENAEFAQRCDDEGITFIGPSPEVIRRMGSKIEAKAVAEAAGVPVIPGYHGIDQSDTKLSEEAQRIGTPLLIKASAGGGGRGMRVVDDLDDFSETLQTARAEALSAFGDDAVLLERYLRAPRHVEVQLLCDKHGHCLHLFERDCSIQRNHQKVIEEAPAPGLPDDIRERLTSDAVRLARSIGYDSVGTAEFLWEPESGETFFLEMNTRLQVEHPVTEAVTGLDLVAWQIRVAAGDALPMAQADIVCHGHAIEARIAAEDPANGYAPQVGTVDLYREPDLDGLRVDSGVDTGSDVTPHYDSMIAKVIGSGETRDAALAVLRDGLSRMTVSGIGTNLEFVHDIVGQPAFAAARLHTGFLSDAFPDGWQAHPADERLGAMAAVLALPAPTGGVWNALGPWRITEPSGRRGAGVLYVSGSGMEPVALRVEGQSGTVSVFAEERPVWRADRVQVSDNRLTFREDGARHDIGFVRSGDLVTLYPERGAVTYKALPPEIALLGRKAEQVVADGSAVIAPMPGLVTEIRVNPGDTVKQGDVAVLFEAMKMVQSLAVPRDGIVRAVNCTAGTFAEGRSVLIELEE